MASDTSKRTITATKNYRLFTVSDENRPRNAKKHKKLRESMQLYGFLSSFPVVCVRDKAGALVVKDGQHRLMFAEELNLPVHYAVEATDFDVAVVNSTAKVWSLIDYAQKHAAHGVQAYIDGLSFADRYRLPVGTAFALLAGTTTFSNVQGPFIDGTFKIRDRQWAESVALLYGGLLAISRNVLNKRCIEACMAVCRVKGFDSNRLIQGAQRNREALVSYSTRDGYLEMMETIYNFGRRQLVPLKISAVQSMRERAPVRRKQSKAAAA
jgi:hypothetical protein